MPRRDNWRAHLRLGIGCRVGAGAESGVVSTHSRHRWDLIDSRNGHDDAADIGRMIRRVSIDTVPVAWHRIPLRSSTKTYAYKQHIYWARYAQLGGVTRLGHSGDGRGRVHQCVGKDHKSCPAPSPSLLVEHRNDAPRTVHKIRT